MGLQIEHWDKVCDRWNGASEFLDWLWEKYRVELSFDYANPGTPLDRRRLLNECFEVDDAALDNERVAMLEAFRAKHAIS